jgi:DNA-directed RNA polymerase subunit RPC12/RpoP
MSIYENVGKGSRNLRICGDCGIVYTSVSLTKYVDQCPLCNSKRFESMSSKPDIE